MPIGEIFLDVRLLLLVAVFFFALDALYSSAGPPDLLSGKTTTTPAYP